MVCGISFHCHFIQAPEIHTVQDLSFFLTRIIGEEKGLLLGLISAFLRISCISASMEFFWLCDILYGLRFGGLAHGRVGML
jgi:hypothetical protein